MQKKKHQHIVSSFLLSLQIPKKKKRIFLFLPSPSQNTIFFVQEKEKRHPKKNGIMKRTQLLLGSSEERRAVVVSLTALFLIIKLFAVYNNGLVDAGVCRMVDWELRAATQHTEPPNRVIIHDVGFIPAEPDTVEPDIPIPMHEVLTLARKLELNTIGINGTLLHDTESFVVSPTVDLYTFSLATTFAKKELFDVLAGCTPKAGLESVPSPVMVTTDQYLYDFSCKEATLRRGRKLKGNILVVSGQHIATHCGGIVSFACFKTLATLFNKNLLGGQVVLQRGGVTLNLFSEQRFSNAMSKLYGKGANGTRLKVSLEGYEDCARLWCVAPDMKSFAERKGFDQARRRGFVDNMNASPFGPLHTFHSALNASSAHSGLFVEKLYSAPKGLNTASTDRKCYNFAKIAKKYAKGLTRHAYSEKIGRPSERELRTALLMQPGEGGDATQAVLPHTPPTAGDAVLLEVSATLLDEGPDDTTTFYKYLFAAGICLIIFLRCVVGTSPRSGRRRKSKE